mmetsp:Transcript_35730/g.48269  ORF Transcript_35730/g.48269 Transcript_35730/m.48269 type:complete len:295 (-) Transcript_35730:674-1558(-)
MPLSSSPGSMGNLEDMLAESESLTDDTSVSKEHCIEIERKVELHGESDVVEFERKVRDSGGTLLSSISFTDCYFDSPELILTRTDHYLRDRDGIWELKVPSRRNGSTTSVYEEIEGAQRITEYFSKHFSHGNVLLPFGDQEKNSGDKDCGDCSNGESSTASAFVTFTTTRRRWKLLLGEEEFTIDVDATCFGYCLAELELMVLSDDDDAVLAALASIDSACEALGVIGAANQDRASKFVQFILEDPELLERTMLFCPAVLALEECTNVRPNRVVDCGEEYTNSQIFDESEVENT